MADGSDALPVESVVWLMTGHERYGVLRAVTTLAGGLRQAGVSVAAVVLEDGPAVAAVESVGLETRVLGLGKAPAFSGGLLTKAAGVVKGWRYRRRAVPEVVAALREMGGGVLQVLWPNLVGLAAQAASEAGQRCVWEMPNTLSSALPFDVNRWLYRRACRRYGVLVLANSAYTGASLAGGGADGVEPVTFHLGVDPGVFDPSSVDPMTRAELGIPNGAVVLGVVARLDPSKGQDRLWEAVLGQVRGGVDLHLLVLGGPTDGELAGRMVSAAESAGQRDRLHLLGRVEEPQRYYGAMDVAVNSRVDPEPFGLSVVEGLMMGVPTLVHALGGPAETVSDGMTGWHITDPSVPGFEAGLTRVLADRQRWPEMGRAARVEALKRFSVGAQVDRYFRALRAAFGGSA
ncbi:MAG: glycosyltransferase family 4 protein [Planctomycetota bacterium]